MRNLKKILALVLALVMSLSLMAVASADDELNLGDVSDVYAESVDVLTGLKVFMGNKGEFLPKDNITRAEVAAIIYRIVTGDVTNSQNGIYADYNKFSDVTSDAWYAGYVNYCANAEYVKGVGYDANGKAMFKPQQNVTGYEALAMILRAIGYDRNNEFTGPSWQIQTAATARNRGILKNIAEGTLGGAATREAVAEILCQTILVPVADYSLAFGYRTTDANGKDNETLAYKTFKMEKIDGVVVANEQASLEDATPLAAGQTKLNLADGGSYTLNVASTLDDIGESRYVYVTPAAGTTRHNLVTSKVYDTGLNNVYDSGEPVSSVSNSTGSEQGITSIANALHYINYDQATQYEAKIRIEYVIRLRMSQYDAMVLYNTNGTADNSELYPINPDGTNGTKITRPSSIADTTWNTTITSNGYTLNGVNYDHTYEYHKVINAFTKLTDTDYEYIRSIFAAADRIDNTLGNYILGEVYVGTTSVGTAFITVDASGNLVLSNTTRDVSDTMKWEDFAAQYLDIQENKAQITKNERGNRLKIVDNDNNGVADYILQTIYTVGIINANGGLDIAGVKMTDGDSFNEVTASTKVINDGEGELATGNVVIYAKIDGNARAQLAATETAKINTVNRAAKTATAVDSTEAWNESWVHTHSPNLQSYVSNLVTNTTYTLYFDLYGNLAAFTEGDNGQFVLITDGWYNNTIAGGEFAVQTWVDGTLQTTNVTENGSLFVNREGSGNTWGKLKTTFGNGSNINHANGDNDQVHTIVANLENGVLTPVDKMYRYGARYDVIDMNNNVVPGRDNLTSTGTPYETNYADGTNTAYRSQVRDGNNNLVSNVEVRALTTTTYYYVYKNIGSSAITNGSNVVVRTYTGFNSIPSINRTYIEDVYVVGQRATSATNNLYYTANVVVVELNSKYNGTMNDSEQVFIPDFSEVSGNLTIENVRMIRGTGVEETVKVDMRQSNLDWYDEAGNLVRASNNRDRRPGLFYMDLIDGSSDTYAIKRMTNQDIRANNYMAGYVEKATSIVGDDYAQVRMLVRPQTGANVNSWVSSFTNSNLTHADRDVIWTLRPLMVGTEITNSDIVGLQSKSVVNDNLYTLSYSSNVATLTKADKSVVLAQTRGDAINNTTFSALNERWVHTHDTDTNVFNNFSRNEVLVRYGADGNVIWAVSFAEGETSNNYAQQVWYNCLPAQTYNVSRQVEFFGVTDSSANDRDGAATVNNVITVDYKDALASGKIIDLDGIAATISSYTLSKGNTPSGVNANATTGVTSTNWSRMSAQDEDNQRAVLTGAEYRLDVTTNTGNVETYYLIQRAASATDTLVPDTYTSTGGGTPVITANGNGSTYYTVGLGLLIPGETNAPTNPDRLDIDKYVETFQVTDYRSSITFEFWQKNGSNTIVASRPDFTVQGNVEATSGNVTVGTVTGDINRVTTDEIAAVRVTVTAENGIDKTVYTYAGTGVTGFAKSSLTLTGTPAFGITYKGTTHNSAGSFDVNNGEAVTLAPTTATQAGTFYADGVAIGTVNGTTVQSISWVPTGDATITFVAKKAAAVAPGSDASTPVAGDTYVDETTDEIVEEYTVTVPDGKEPVVANPQPGVQVSFAKNANGTWKMTVRYAANAAAANAAAAVQVATKTQGAADVTVTLTTSASQITLPTETTQSTYVGGTVTFTVASTTGVVVSKGSNADVSIANDGFNYTVTVSNVTANTTVNLESAKSGVMGVDVTTRPQDVVIDETVQNANNLYPSQFQTLAFTEGVRVFASSTTASGTTTHKSIATVSDAAVMKVFVMAADKLTYRDGSTISENDAKGICYWWHGKDWTLPADTTYAAQAFAALSGGPATGSYLTLVDIVFDDGSRMETFLGSGASSTGDQDVTSRFKTPGPNKYIYNAEDVILQLRALKAADAG